MKYLLFVFSVLIAQMASAVILECAPKQLQEDSFVVKLNSQHPEYVTKGLVALTLVEGVYGGLFLRIQNAAVKLSYAEQGFRIHSADATTQVQGLLFKANYRNKETYHLSLKGTDQQGRTFEAAGLICR